MKFRGFHPEEVSSFLEQIREELEDLLRENAALKDQIQKADDEIGKFWGIQDQLSRALQDAHQVSEEYKIRARKEADDLLEKAEETARDIASEAHEKALQISEEITELKMLRAEFDKGIKNILSRFEAVIEGGKVPQEITALEKTESAAKSDDDMDLAAGAPLLTEDQISIIEGHRGEEGSSESEQY